MKRALLAFVLLCNIFICASAQYCPYPGQSPNTAIPVCGTVKFVCPAPLLCGGGVIPNPGTGCQPNTYREEAQHWYKFTCNQGGTFRMTITPHDLPNDDYDWAIFDITGLMPNDIYTNPNICISSNWTWERGATGTSPTATDQYVCMGQGAAYPNFSRMPILTTNHTYLVLVNTIYPTVMGYDIEFAGGTAVISDNVLPVLTTAGYDAANTIVEVNMNKDIMCSTIAYDGSDFVINPGNITAISAEGGSCSSQMHAQKVLLTLAQPLPPGNYTVTIKDGSDANTVLDFCNRPIPANSQVPLIIGAPMTLNPGQVDPTCNGAGNGQASVSVNGGVLPFSYSWNTIPVQTSATATDLGPGTYTCTVTDAVNATQTVSVTIADPSPMQFSISYTNVTCTGGSDGTANVGVSGGLPPYTYNWPQNGGQTTAAITGMSPGTFTCDVTDANNCTHSLLVTIGLDNPLPLAVAGADVHLCDGTSFTLAGNAPSPGTGRWLQINGPSNLTFSNDTDPSATIANIQPGVYMLRWTIDNGNGGCASGDDIVITRQLPMVPDAGPDTTIRNVSTYRMNAEIPSSGTWQQLGGPGIAAFDDINDPQSLISNLQEGTYTFRWVLDMGPCPAISDDVTIVVEKECSFRMPNAFSPNGDGQNDVFKPARICGATQYELSIYNRWGAKIYTGNDPMSGWNGTFLAKQQAVQTYVWIVTYTGADQKRYMHRGTVLLTR